MNITSSVTSSIITPLIELSAMAGSSFVKEDMNLILWMWTTWIASCDGTHTLALGITPRFRRTKLLKVSCSIEERTLSIAKDFDGMYAQHLAEFVDGCVLLDSEDVGEYAADHKFWRARTAYYKSEYDKLMGEEKRWREPTAEIP